MAHRLLLAMGFHDVGHLYPPLQQLTPLTASNDAMISKKGEREIQSYKSAGRQRHGKLLVTSCHGNLSMLNSTGF